MSYFRHPELKLTGIKVKLPSWEMRESDFSPLRAQWLNNGIHCSAHQLPPFSGQGLNSGIRDAAGLAWRLGLILGAGAGRDIMRSYNLERRAHVDFVMERSIALGQPICETDPVIAKFMVSCH